MIFSWILREVFKDCSENNVDSKAVETFTLLCRTLDKTNIVQAMRLWKQCK